MSALETTVSILMATLLVAVAVYFTWRQRATMRSLQFNEDASPDQRRFLIKQTQRRMLGAFLLLLLAGMLIGSLFLNYDALRQPLNELPAADAEASKQIVRFISFYWMAFLIFLMVLVSLAIIDLWATARNALHLQKKLIQEHQAMLEAELAEIRNRRAEMN